MRSHSKHATSRDPGLVAWSLPRALVAFWATGLVRFVGLGGAVEGGTEDFFSSDPDPAAGLLSRNFGAVLASLREANGLLGRLFLGTALPSAIWKWALHFRQ